MVDLNNKTILVTGGCGFIGSNFVKYVDKHYKNVVIVNVDKLGVGSISGLEDQLENNTYCGVYRDLIHRNASGGTIPRFTWDYVFHFAAESHVDRSINSPYSFIENNVMSTTAVLEHVRTNTPKARVILVSTDEVYGYLEKDDMPFSELSPYNPSSPYSASKAASDLIGLSYVSTYGLDVIVTRCCNNFGPNQHSEKFIPTVIRSLVQGTKIPVYGTGENIREWIYVDDHNKSILDITQQGRSGLVYNIGSGVERTNLAMINDILIMGNFGGSIMDHVEFVTDRQGHDFRYAISSLWYKRSFELSTYFKVLSETIEHYRELYS